MYATDAHLQLHRIKALSDAVNKFDIQQCPYIQHKL